MSIWGKIIGAFFGYLLAREIGLVLGVIIGHMFDSGFSKTWQHFANFNPHHTQHAFFKASFLVMGHLAKADGRVSENEIKAAEKIMQRMRLNATQRQQAIQYFQAGKNSQFNLDDCLDELIQQCQHRMLLQMFVEIQFQAAQVDGIHQGNKQAILEHICQHLGLSPSFNFYQQSYQQHKQHQGRQQYRRQSHQPQQRHRLQDDYATLQITQDASVKEIKRAYRKQMSTHHPDKLIAQGLPEGMVKLATEKTQQIQGAYDRIKSAKGF